MIGDDLDGGPRVEESSALRQDVVAGVRLRRAFGFGETSDYDPFLLFDDFRNENPEDYLAGFPWHPHRGIETITYVLAGTVYYEVPGLFGGDLEKSERLFRAGLEVDGRFTGLRVGLARTLIKRGRVPEARRELQAVLDEKAASNAADWTLKDSEARRLLADLPARP